jgi:hypothetical protein
MQIISMFALERIEHWKTVLEINNWDIICSTIDENQVVDSLMGNTHGHEFVGIERNFQTLTGIIYHTRPLDEEDIIHELLHVRYSNWSEEKVDFWTTHLIGKPALHHAKAMEYLLPTG